MNTLTNSKTIRVRTQVKAGIGNNHNENQTSGLRLKTHLKAGAMSANHNETVR